jgi:hypothetical protein
VIGHRCVPGYSSSGLLSDAFTSGPPDYSTDPSVPEVRMVGSRGIGAGLREKMMVLPEFCCLGG